MIHHRPSSRRLLAAFLVLESFAAPAFAYIDPGAGSIAIQLLMAAALAGIFKVRAVFAALRRWFRKLTGRYEPVDD